ncbi:amino acid aminotransferase [Kerstersia sp.]|uniref:amino acid aminotransferase n=1 Tax=Kerstersia sp. TaxID=1930783 RepID=UPI003F8DA11E
MFEHIPPYPGDPILTLNEEFQKDPRQDKVNLSIGIYLDDHGRLPVMAAVRAAEETIGTSSVPKPYLPMTGSPAYATAVQELVFGSAAPNVATAQTLGGSGALKVGADFIRRYFPESQVWLSDPSWENHRFIFERAGFTVNTYPYYDAETGSLKFDAMLAAVRQLPAQSVLLLHACCHNPTGVDLNEAQWLAILDAVQERGLLPFVDMAYQGFGAGIASDAFVIRELLRRNIPAFVANSFSKNFSLYGERCGGLSLICEDQEAAQRVLGQLASVVRSNYSSPPVHGVSVITQVLSTPALRAQWEEQLTHMRERMLAMRAQLFQLLSEKLNGTRCASQLDRYVQQRGMFTYTGLNASQVDKLRHEHGVYILRSGRMCVAGLNESNVGRVADAVAKVMQQP